MLGTWMGYRRSAVHRSAERKVILSETVNWEQNGGLCRHRFSAVFLCPRANAIKHEENSQRRVAGNSGGKNGKGENGKKGGREMGICKRE